MDKYFCVIVINTKFPSFLQPNFEIRHNVETVMQSAILYLLGFLPCGTGG